MGFIFKMWANYGLVIAVAFPARDAPGGFDLERDRAAMASAPIDHCVFLL